MIESNKFSCGAKMINQDLFASQLSFRQFDKIFCEQLQKIPDVYREGIAQFILEEKEHRHHRYMPGLYTLGQYMPHGHFGQPVIILYFGSFKRAFPHHQVPELSIEVAKTLAHELLHHWELRSGYDDLGDEDRQFLLDWKIKTNYHPGRDSVGRNLFEAGLYIYMVLILVGVIARWIGVAI